MWFIFLALCLTVVSAKPNGLYHQEYSYKSSQSSYQNNELQHKNDAEGFYSKSGDIEGRVKPKINQHSQQSEYINPKLIELSNTNYHGNSNKMSGAGSSEHHLSEEMQQLQTDMLAKLQNAIHNQYRQRSDFGDFGRLSTSNQYNVHQLEAELRRNLTREFDQYVREHYRHSSNAYQYQSGGNNNNYNEQNLDQLKNQVEQYLIEELKDRVKTQYHYPIESHHSRPNNAYQSNSYNTNSNRYQAPIRGDHQYNSHLTTIASNVQNQLDRNLNVLLDDMDKNVRTNRGGYLELDQRKLHTEIHRNISRDFDRELQFNPYQSISGSKQYDIESLKQQIERHLTTKLDMELEKMKTNYVSYNRQNTGVSQGTEVAALQRQLSEKLQDALRRNAHQYHQYHNRNEQQADYSATLDRLRAELDRNITQCLTEREARLQYKNSGGYNNQNMEQIRAQLQNNLGEQLQEGLQKSWSSYSSWSSSSSYQIGAIGPNTHERYRTPYY